MRRLLPLLLMLLLLGACARGPEGPGAAGGAEPPAADTTQEEPPAEPSQRIVTADWSRLETPEPPPAAERWYDGYTDRLIPRDDYGPLLPYAGLRLADDWPAGRGCLYGLMTADGRVVTDPVFTNVYRLGRYNLAETLPLMALEQPDPDAAPDDYDPRIYALAAADGSWCTDFDIVGIVASHASVQLFRQDGVQLLDTAGKPLRSWTVPELGIPRETYDTLLNYVPSGYSWRGECRGGWLVLDDDNAGETILAFHTETGALRTLATDEWLVLDPAWNAPYVEPPPPAVADAFRLEDPWLGTAAPGLLEVREFGGDGRQTLRYYLEDGTPLPQFTLTDPDWCDSVTVSGGRIQVLTREEAAYYDLETQACVFRTSLFRLPEEPADAETETEEEAP